MHRLADVELATEELCARAGLVYVDHSGPGWLRRRHGRGFTYRRPSGEVINGSERAWIEDLAIPPAWTEVWICPRRDGHLLAVGRDDAGRLQYIYHPGFRAEAERTKYRRLGPFGAALENLRRAVHHDLAGDDPERRMLAATVRLLDRGLLRVGTREPEDPDDAVGATTLGPDHVTVDAGAGAVDIDYTGKGGASRHVRVEDAELARAVRDGLDLGAEAVFAYGRDGAVLSVTAVGVNDYLLDRTGQAFTAKDFRTWGGTVTVALELARAGPPENDDDHHRSVLDAVDVAAEQLGNSRDIARQSYLSPVVTEAHRDGQLHELWARTRRGAWASRAERTTMRVHATRG